MRWGGAARRLLTHVNARRVRLVASFAVSDDGFMSHETPVPAPIVGDASLPAIRVADPRTPAMRTVLLVFSGAIFCLLLTAAVVLPSPYAIASPGPTFDLLEEVDGEDLVTVSGVPTYEPDGSLRITTVQLSDASSANFTLRPVVEGWFRSDRTVVPVEYYWPEDAVDEPVSSAQQEWITSQELATVSALSEYGVDVPAELLVVDFDPESHSIDLLQVGDLIVAAQGSQVLSLAELSDVLDGLAPGDDIAITVDRGGELVDVSFATRDDGSGGAVMGVWIDPEFTLPVDVDVRIDQVGGPSAGMMFSLAILSLLTPEDEVAGALVAGTGTVDLEGAVGPIGGIGLKMFGARADGADFFIAPEANCAEIVGHIPDGLGVVTVEDLGEAYDALVAIGAGRGDELTACAADA